MNVPFALTRACMILAMGALVVLAAAGFAARQNDIATLEMARKEGVYWSASQVELETARFVGVLAQFALGEPGVDAAAVNARFDLLWSRTSVFRQGEIGARLRAYDGATQTIDRVEALLHRHEAAVIGIARGGPDAARAVARDFDAIRDDLRRLSTRVVTGEEARLAQVRDSVHASTRRSTIVTLAALGLALLLVGIMLAETRRYRAQALAAADLAARADAASRVKARFLTMMSHELRTPMNGVLGTLALMRQAPLTEAMARMVAQADRAGQRMHALLGDIFDLSDLQAEDVVLNDAPIELRPLLARLAGDGDPEGAAIVVTRAPGTPDWVKGDGPRMEQALGHILAYLTDTIGSRDIAIRLAHDTAGLTVDFDTRVPGPGEPGWQPEAMLGTGGVGYDDFASDALGPMIARGLVDLMGGSVAILRHQVGRAVVRVTLPTPAADARPAFVRIEAPTVTLHAVARALLARAAWPVWNADIDPRQVSVALVEAGGEDEAETVLRMRRLHPAARVVALGDPVVRALFDGACPLPLTPLALTQALGPVPSAPAPGAVTPRAAGAVHPEPTLRQRRAP